MSVDIVVPTLGESISEATVTQWYKQPGDAIGLDEPICELETDKVTVDVPAAAAGALAEIIVADGEVVEVGAVLGRIDEGKAGKAPAPAAVKVPAEAQSPTPQPPAPPKPPPPPPTNGKAPPPPPKTPPPQAQMPLSPAVRHLLAQHRLDAAQIIGTGRGGRLTKGDVLAALETPPSQARAPQPPQAKMPPGGYPTERVKMSRLRRTIATRLKESQNIAATLTTFNEVDMSALMALRKQHKDAFEQQHGVRLGFMGFFVRACVIALQEIPNVNAQIDGEEIVYSHAVHMGIAVSTERGLVVPVVRDVQTKMLAQIEQEITELGGRARDGKLKLEELQGGTFTISNGGVFGSLLSTPILNTPQSGVLGMHRIQERAVVVQGKVVARPMMYLALSYDHRLVDGREAVTFLVRVKETLEDPERILLGV